MIAGVSFLIIGVAVWYLLYVASPQSQISAALEQGQNLLLAASSSEAIAPLQYAIDHAPDIASKDLAQLNLASAYLHTSTVAQGVQMLKSISLDATYPAYLRATATEVLVSYMLSSYNREATAQLVFSGPTWGDFMGTSATSSIYIASGKALIWGVNTYPLFSSEYLIAKLYSDAIAYSSSGVDISNYTQQAQFWLAKGDATYVSQVHPDGSSQALQPYFVGQGLSYKAQTLADLYESGATPGPAIDKVNAAFASSTQVFEANANSLTISQDIFTRLSWAAFLARVDASSYHQQIISILGPVDTSTNIVFISMLQAAPKNPQLQTGPDYNNLVALSKIDPALHNLLVSFGWGN